MEDMTGEYEGLRMGYVFFLFREKERTKEKSIGCSCAGMTLIRYRGYGFLYTRGGVRVLL